jgi:hypothetical protein
MDGFSGGDGVAELRAQVRFVPRALRTSKIALWGNVPFTCRVAHREARPGRYSGVLNSTVTSAFSIGCRGNMAANARAFVHRPWAMAWRKPNSFADGELR